MHPPAPVHVLGSRSRPNFPTCHAPPRSVTREEVEAAKAMSLRELKARWTELVAEGRPFLDHEHTDPAAAAALSSVGARMGRLLALACLWNLDAVFLKFMSTRTDGDEAALADRASAVWVDRETAEDADMALWERGVRAARLTREQVRYGAFQGLRQYTLYACGQVAAEPRAATFRHCLISTVQRPTPPCRGKSPWPPRTCLSPAWPRCARSGRGCRRSWRCTLQRWQLPRTAATRRTSPSQRCWRTLRCVAGCLGV